MKKWKLSLNKTKMYQLMERASISLPLKKDCFFTHYGATYWMDFWTFDEDHIRVCVQTVLGSTMMHFTNMTEDIELYKEHISFPYLEEHGLLREVG